MRMGGKVLYIHGVLGCLFHCHIKVDRYLFFFLSMEVCKIEYLVSSLTFCRIMIERLFLQDPSSIFSSLVITKSIRPERFHPIILSLWHAKRGSFNCYPTLSPPSNSYLADKPF